MRELREFVDKSGNTWFEVRPGRLASALSDGGARRLGWALLAVADNADREGGAGVS